MKLFLTSQASKVLDKIVKTIERPSNEMFVAFIPTASDPYGDDKPWMNADRDKLKELGFNVTNLDIKNKVENNIRKELSKFDIIFVAGGNTFYLLEKMKKSGTDKVINELKDSDKIYIGSSAGSCVTGPDIEPIAVFDDPSKTQLKSTKALGLVNFIVLPHADKEKYTQIHEKIIRDFSNKYKIIQITDEQMIVVDNGKFELV